MIQLNDLFIGDFSITQSFGARPDVYAWIKDSNGNSIKGHNGVDIGTPTGSQMLSPYPKDHDVIVTKVGYEEKGYGNYVRLWDKTQQCVVLYAHLQEVRVKEGEKCYFQQLVGLTDNTGWSDGPHCHIGFYLVDSEGNKLNRSNGYDGYQNILDTTLVHFTLLNPSHAGDVPLNQNTITINKADYDKKEKDYEFLRSNYQDIVNYVSLNKPALNTSAGEIMILFNAVREEMKMLQNENTGLHGVNSQLDSDLKNCKTAFSLLEIADQKKFDTKQVLDLQDKNEQLKKKLAQLTAQKQTEVLTKLEDQMDSPIGFLPKAPDKFKLTQIPAATLDQFKKLLYAVMSL